MTLVICICTYNRNPSLVKCLKSINNLLVNKKVKVKIVIVDNSINYSSFKTVKKLKKSFKYKIIQLHEKRRGVVYARNKCLSKLNELADPILSSRYFTIIFLFFFVIFFDNLILSFIFK